MFYMFFDLPYCIVYLIAVLKFYEFEEVFDEFSIVTYITVICLCFDATIIELFLYEYGAIILF